MKKLILQIKIYKKTKKCCITLKNVIFVHGHKRNLSVVLLNGQVTLNGFYNMIFKRVYYKIYRKVTSGYCLIIKSYIIMYSELQSTFIGLNECCEFTGYSKSAIYQKTCRKEIPHYKRGSKLLFKKSEILDWINAGRVETVEEACQQFDATFVKGRV